MQTATIKQYEIGQNGKLISVDESAGRGLPVGTVLRWGGNRGWASCDLVIVMEREGGYDCYNRDEPDNNARLHVVDYYSIKHEDDPALWHTQHMFLTPEIVSSDEVTELLTDHQAQAALWQANQDTTKAKADQLEAEGRILWSKIMPEGTTHIIIAENMHDDSDPQTDYFASHATETVILAASKHGRDNFAEMRKAAAKISETQHLATAPSVDSNKEPRTESNKAWWHPADEHREKYANGNGYYLQAGHGSGWTVRKDQIGSSTWNPDTRKHEISSSPNRDTCIMLAKRYAHFRNLMR